MHLINNIIYAVISYLGVRTDCNINTKCWNAAF